MNTIHKLKLRPNPFIDKFYGEFSFQRLEDIQFYRNIIENGILTPLIITPSGFIISGNRRYYCAMRTSKIKDLPVVIMDINEDEVDDYLVVSLQQYRIKTDIQIAREYEIIGRKYEIRRGKGNEIRNAEGKIERAKLLENLSSVSETTIKRILVSHKLLMELDNLIEEDAWSKLTYIRNDKKKEPNTIFKELEARKAERENQKLSKKTNLLINNEFFKIFNINSRDLSNILDDNTIDCVCTSPPYFSGIRTYSEDNKEIKNSDFNDELEQLGHENTPEEYIDKLVVYIRECIRVSKSTGSIWINIADTRKGGKYYNVPEKLLIALEKENITTAQKCIWFKNNPPYDNNNVFQPSMEHIFHFVLDPKKYKWRDNWFDEADEFIGNITYGDKDKKRKFRNVFIYPTNKDERNINDGSGFVSSLIETNVINNSYLNKLLRSKGYSLQHNALYSFEIPMICILSTTDKNDSVLDIFSGQSTSGLVAYAHGCRYFGVELSGVYCAQSIVRFEDFVLKNPTISRIDN
jgi:DNA modification methylase